MTGKQVSSRGRIRRSPCRGRLLAAALCWLGIAPAVAAADRSDLDAGLAQLAGGLLQQLGDVAPTDGNPVRIAVWPLDDEHGPLQPAQADRLNRLLRQHLRIAAPPWLRLVARDDMPALLADASEFAATPDPVAALVEEAAVDVLIVGHVSRHDHGLRLSYDAYAVRDGTLLAGSGPLSISHAAIAIAPQLGLEAAIRQMARSLRETAPDMTELRLHKVGYQDSGQQPAFGTYVQDLMVAALEQAFADGLTGRKLVVRPDAAPAANAARSYVLSGSYWEAGAAVDLRFRLRNGRGASVSTRRLVDGASLPTGVALRPAAGADGAVRPAAATIGLTLSTDRGDAPVYRIGEPFSLLVGLDRAAWLYCFYRQADGAIVRIVPNRHLPAARLAGGRIHAVPGRDAAFALIADAPAGNESVTCFATSEDVQTRLPAPLRAGGSGRLPAGWDWRLGHAFHRLPAAAVAEARVTITVRP